jgi:hypothetical protein
MPHTLDGIIDGYVEKQKADATKEAKASKPSGANPLFFILIFVAIIALFANGTITNNENQSGTDPYKDKLLVKYIPGETRPEDKKTLTLKELSSTQSQETKGIVLNSSGETIPIEVKLNEVDTYLAPSNSAPNLSQNELDQLQNQRVDEILQKFAPKQPQNPFKGLKR